MTRLFARWIVVSCHLAFYRWAASEIDRQHEDAPALTVHVNNLAHEQRNLIVALRQWRHTSPTLSAVKTWL